jgi:hypothetical protein
VTYFGVLPDVSLCSGIIRATILNIIVVSTVEIAPI